VKNPLQIMATKPASIHNNQATQYTCKFCNCILSSRNELFRHLANTDCGAQMSVTECGNQPSGIPPSTIKASFAIEFSYYRSITNETDVDFHHANIDTVPSSSCEAKVAGEIVQTALQEAITNLTIENEYPQQVNRQPLVDIVSSSQVSVAKNRHPALTQEASCAAARDVLICTMNIPRSVPPETEMKKMNFIESILSHMNKSLQRAESSLKNKSSYLDLVVCVNACKWLSRDNSPKRILNAESDCSQRVYHYLLPLEWLSKEQAFHDKVSKYDRRTNSFDLFATEPVRNFQRALKEAVCPAMPNRRTRRKSLQPDIDHQNYHGTGTKSHLSVIDPLAFRAPLNGASGTSSRFRRPWHNFCDPRLRGDASPNNKNVWRILEKAKIVSFTKSNSSKLHAVIEFRGDDFCHEQIRRIVGTAVAISNGWLPEDFLQVATRADSWFETPAAPAGRLFMYKGTFYADKSRSKQELFEHGAVALSRDYESAHLTLQHRLLEQRAETGSLREEETWLQSLEFYLGPKICRQIEKAAEASNQCWDEIGENEKGRLAPAPADYRETVSILTDILQSKKWPQTSTARSNVIKKPDSNFDDSQHGARSGGSFTVVNRKAVPESFELPMANSLFPDLAEEVFKLEELLALSQLPRADGSGGVVVDVAASRAPSTHCAVNANAEFTPHVDSGRGLGQTLSMIVGLGDYLGGEIMIEGNGHDVRYQPLQFDGWHLRHWTGPCKGRRFSLVWFSPADIATERD
jgi:tRNA U38,U39,U40 pseudouridine synthase TruA